MLDESRTKRLAFKRYVYDLAVEQSRQLKPMNAPALLTPLGRVRPRVDPTLGF